MCLESMLNQIIIIINKTLFLIGKTILKNTQNSSIKILKILLRTCQ